MAKATIAGFCPRYHQAVELIGRRWTGAVVRLLLSGPKRFVELTNGIPDISDRMLTERLRELEAEAIVTRTVIPEIPVRVEYSLTAKGHALEGAIRALATWAEAWMDTDQAAAPPPAAVANRGAKAKSRAG
jgi:DNA-binding HxlR family transcriptional regulator